jgi:hypothetical protein
VIFVARGSRKADLAPFASTTYKIGSVQSFSRFGPEHVAAAVTIVITVEQVRAFE